ncbi:MAG: class F420-dependent oxidoreductase [Frankiales bacterium]|nr:class F420-dependent oxidoreductase [Frankiales bacterium]
MKFGVLAPHVGFNSGRTILLDVAQAADELGFDSIWASDHVIMPVEQASPYPFSDDNELGVAGAQPYFEMVSTLGFLAAATTAVQIGVAVAVLPYRHPVVFAKAVSTIDQLAEGRFVLGAGTGWLREEFEALGQRFNRRGAYTNEILRFLRTAWSAEQPVTFEGEFIKLAPAFFVPGAFSNRRIPFWIGGNGEAAVERTALLGDAWFPHLFGSSPETVQRTREQIARIRSEAGIDAPVGTALYLPMSLSAHDEPGGERPWQERAFRGSPAQLRAALAKYGAAGVDHVVLMFGGRADARIQTMRVLQKEVLQTT